MRTKYKWTTSQTAVCIWAVSFLGIVVAVTYCFVKASPYYKLPAFKYVTVGFLFVTVAICLYLIKRDIASALMMATTIFIVCSLVGRWLPQPVPWAMLLCLGSILIVHVTAHANSSLVRPTSDSIASEQGHRSVPSTEVNHCIYHGTIPATKLENLFGMQETVQRLRQAAMEVTGDRRKAARNGILLHGAPGNGKTTFARALAGEFSLPMITVDWSSVASRYINETSENLRQVFADACRQAPCALFFDEVDSFLQSRQRSASTNEETRQIVNLFLTEIVNVRSKGVLLIAATNHLETLDAAAIREGRFDYKIEVPAPDAVARVRILQSALHQISSFVDMHHGEIERTAIRWEGFSVKRLQAVGEEVIAMVYAHRAEYVDSEVLHAALKQVQGSKGRLPENTKTLDDLVITSALRSHIDLLLQRMCDMDRTEQLGGTVPNGVLFIGPPGSGKTETARAIAKASGWSFLATTGYDLVASTTELDRLVSSALDLRPCIVFLDEVEDVLARRTSGANVYITNKLLAVLDGIAGKVPDVLFIAATNHAERLDPAATRAGRFTEKLHFSHPDHAGMTIIAQRWLSGLRIECDENLTAQFLAEKVRGMSVADAIAVFSHAVNLSLVNNRHWGLPFVDRHAIDSAKDVVVGHSQQ